MQVVINGLQDQVAPALPERDFMLFLVQDLSIDRAWLNHAMSHPYFEMVHNAVQQVNVKDSNKFVYRNYELDVTLSSFVTLFECFLTKLSRH